MSIRMCNDHVDLGHVGVEEEESYPIYHPDQAEAEAGAETQTETETDHNEIDTSQPYTPNPSREGQAQGQAYIPYSSSSPSSRPLPQCPPDRNHDLGQIQVPNQAPKQRPSYRTFQPHRYNRSYDFTHVSNPQERYHRRSETSSGFISQVRSVSPRKPVQSLQPIAAFQLPLPPNTTETDTELSSYASSQNTQITQPMTPTSPLPPVPSATSQSPLSQCHYQSDEEGQPGELYAEQPKTLQPPAYSKKFVVVGDGGCGQQWYPEVLHFCPSTPLILVGLKSDLRTKRTCIELLKTQGLTPVTIEQGQAVATRMGAKYIECSSKEMHNVKQVFELAVNVVVDVEEEELAFANGGGYNPHRHSIFVTGQTGGSGSGAGDVTADTYGTPARNVGASVGVRGSTNADRSAKESKSNSTGMARRATVAGSAKDAANRTNDSSADAKTRTERKTLGGKKIKKRQCTIL
ncbi:Rho GTPase [Ascosphaera aggregata]|nr:Rho GTPase [Ascosphaera aggregata]